MQLILIRHGETEVNAKGSTHKSGDSAVLTQLGQSQIAKTADRLQDFNVDRLVSSSEKRAMESRDIISQKLDIEVEQLMEFNERNWGKLAGKPWDEIAQLLNGFSLEERYDFIPEEGESWRQFDERLKRGIKKLINNQYKSIALVTHGGAIRAMIPILLDLPKEESFKYSPDNASISIFESRGDKFVLTTYNDTSHL